MESIQKPKKITVRDALSVFKDLVSEIKKRTGKIELPYGIKSLDELTHGLHRKHLCVIGARTSHGKTSLANQFALNLLKENVSVLYVSLEMADTEILERIVANQLKIHAWNLKSGFKEEVDFFIQNQDTIKNILTAEPLIFANNSGRKISELE
mgnify:FL=1